MCLHEELESSAACFLGPQDHRQGETATVLPGHPDVHVTLVQAGGLEGAELGQGESIGELVWTARGSEKKETLEPTWNQYANKNVLTQ